MDTSSIGDSLIINIDNFMDKIVLKLKDWYSVMHCSTKNHWSNLRFLNISGNQLENVANFIEMLQSSVETLDLSLNPIRQLNAHTMEKFMNLKYLNLRNTELSSIDFPLARYNKKLQVLRLENNPIERFDCNVFSLLLSKNRFELFAKFA